MAKRAVLDVLTQTLGKYASLSPEELSVSLFAGKMVINDLSLLPDAINEDFLESGEGGLSVVSGSIKSVNVTVPWNRLGSKSVVVHLQDLSLLVRSDHTKTAGEGKSSSSESPLAKLTDAREKDILHLDKKRRVERSIRVGLEEMADGSSGAAAKKGFVAKLVRRIIENLHVEVSDVTIRVENEKSDMALGCHLEEFSIQSTDESGNPSFIDRDDKKVSERSEQRHF